MGSGVGGGRHNKSTRVNIRCKALAVTHQLRGGLEGQAVVGVK